MQRLPGQDDGLSTDEEAGSAALMGAGRPACRRAGAGLAAAAVALGLAGLALACRVAPWHRAAAAAGSGPPRLDGQEGTRSFVSLTSKSTHLIEWASPGDTTITVEDGGIFAEGDVIRLWAPRNSAIHADATVMSVSGGKITVTEPIRGECPMGCVVDDQPKAARESFPAFETRVTNHGRGDGEAVLPEFDCEAGLPDWETGWSEAKKKWCCENEGKGWQGCEVDGYQYCGTGRISAEECERSTCCGTEVRGHTQIYRICGSDIGGSTCHDKAGGED